MTNFNSTTATTSFANDLVVGTVGWSNASSAYTITGSGTYIPTTEGSVSVSHEELAYQTGANAATAFGFSGTTNSNTSDWGAQVYEFAPPTLTQSVPATGGGANAHATFTGLTTTTNTVTIYYCTGTDASCTAATALGSTTVTPTTNTWTSPQVNGLSRTTTYTSQAYATDAEGNNLVSNVETFIP